MLCGFSNSVILLFLFFGQALNFSLVAPEPKGARLALALALSLNLKCFPALLGGGGGGGRRLEGQGPPDCLHTHLSAADVG